MQNPRVRLSSFVTSRRKKGADGTVPLPESKKCRVSRCFLTTQTKPGTEKPKGVEAERD